MSPCWGSLVLPSPLFFCLPSSFAARQGTAEISVWVCVCVGWGGVAWKGGGTCEVEGELYSQSRKVAVAAAVSHGRCVAWGEMSAVWW